MASIVKPFSQTCIKNTTVPVIANIKIAHFSPSACYLVCRNINSREATYKDTPDKISENLRDAINFPKRSF